MVAVGAIELAGLQATVLETDGRTAGAGVVAAEFLEEFFVAAIHGWKWPPLALSFPSRAKPPVALMRICEAVCASCRLISIDYFQPSRRSPTTLK